MAENGAGVDSICHQPVPESPKLSSPPPSPLAAQRKAQELDEEIYGPRPLVEYLLFAEFDIDKGSIIRHQYPKPCGVDEGYSHPITSILQLLHHLIYDVIELWPKICFLRAHT